MALSCHRFEVRKLGFSLQIEQGGSCVIFGKWYFAQASLPIEIRGYQENDFEQVWNLHELALKATGAFLYGHGSWDDDLKDIETRYLKSGGWFLVVELREDTRRRIIAMGAIRRMDDKHGEIKRMRVHPDFQGKGLGTLILQELEEKACALGYQVLQLDTTVLQRPAINLYTKFGYRETRRDIIGGIETIFFEKKI